MKVKKEATVAVVIGLILALIVTGGVLRAKNAITNMKRPAKDTGSSIPVASGKKDLKSGELFVELTTPDNSVTGEAKLAVTGKTLPGTYIAILGEKGEYLIIPSDAGTFSQEVGLVKGANTITVTVYQTGGTKVERKLNAVYTTAQL